MVVKGRIIQDNGRDKRIRELIPSMINDLLKVQSQLLEFGKHNPDISNIIDEYENGSWGEDSDTTWKFYKKLRDFINFPYKNIKDTIKPKLRSKKVVKHKSKRKSCSCKK